MNLILEAGFGVNQRLVLRYGWKSWIHWRSRVVRAQGQIALEPDAPSCEFTSSRDCAAIVATLGTVGQPSLLRCRKRVEAFIGPIIKHLFQHGADLIGGKGLQAVNPSRLHCAIVSSRIHVDRGVVIQRSKYFIEIDPTVKKAPGYVAHERPQENGNVQRVAHWRTIPSFPANVCKVLVAVKLEAAELERQIAVHTIALESGRGGRIMSDFSSRVHCGSCKLISLTSIGKYPPSVQLIGRPCRSGG